MYLGHTIQAAGALLLLTSRPIATTGTRPLFLSVLGRLTMHLTQLDRECLLHLFSFLDKDSRRSLSLTCHQLREVFLDPCLWTLLQFSSPCQLTKDNFVLGPSLRFLTVCWHSSRVLQVCNIEDWLKSSFQKDICSKHESLVSTFLAHVCHMCPNLLWLTLSGCGHITDQDVISVLQSCRKLRRLHLENCVRITDCSLEGVAAHGHSLEEVKVDFCRNITQSGLQAVGVKRPGIQLSADRSADMIPDSKPDERVPLRRTLQKVLQFS
ncbi:F-box and leucine-rich protein 22 isoform X2 [Sander lucioperca]|uniref:F-box and leucine-rich repeat protein 22 n=1 Tax=Sander lucioperca TaxID=283035 RepID=A0A8C9ZH44_SANLU|nr:F-box and leucine-rich protein 22 isoform X2 [Sander lucioperca]XP_031138631.1 F-box and leucine-rich protein 22 isoform X2 [Sander lucioperca]